MKTDIDTIPQHRGAVLKKAAEESGLSVETIVERMHYASRTTFYNHTRVPDLSLAILKRYSKILNYRFSADIPEMKNYEMEDKDMHYFIAEPHSIEEAIRQRDFYQQQYMFKLEEFRKLKEENYELKQRLSKYL